MIKALGVCGSLRRDSLNRKALGIAENILNKMGAETEEANLAELGLPLFNEDIESTGVPPGVRKIIELASRADLFLFATPEYNGSISGALKNALDWLSRAEKNCLRGKTAAIFGVSSGSLGTLRSQLHLRDILAQLDVLVLPQPQILIKFGEEAFKPDGTFRDPQTEELLTELLRKTLNLVEKAKNK